MLYLIECTNDYETVYKIGYSKHPNKRLNELKTGNEGNLKLINVFEGEYERKIEKTLHRLYSHYNTNREWFKLTINEVVNFNEICKKIENNLIYLNEPL